MTQTKFAGTTRPATTAKGRPFSLMNAQLLVDELQARGYTVTAPVEPDKTETR